MNQKEDIYHKKYTEYISGLTVKRINILIPVAVILLVFLILSDIYIRKSTTAVYTRILPVVTAIFLFIWNKLNKKVLFSKTVLYNLFLALIPAMMYAKFFIHFGDNETAVNTSSIIVSIFIISLEVRAKVLYSILIFFLPSIIFFVSVFLLLPVSKTEIMSLINIIIILIVGFFINTVQNNFRYKTFLSNYLLGIEKKKSEDALQELNRYKDILEKMVAEKTITLKQALEKAKESNLLKTQFLQNISHELRTPVNAILGFGEILAKKDNSFKRETDIINQNINNLLNKIENIILLSKLQTEKTGLEISKFPLSELSLKIEDYASTNINDSKKDIEFIYENNINEDLILNSDSEKIFEILKQLIDNAVKYTENGFIKINISKSDENHIKFTVSDSGFGIPSQDLPHIFEIFRKSENKNKLFGGTGIGLSIAKRMTELLHGELDIKSANTKGTSAVLKLKIDIKQNNETVKITKNIENELQNRSIE